MTQKEIVKVNLISVDVRAFAHEMINLLSQGFGEAEICLGDSNIPLGGYDIKTVKDGLTSETKIILKSKAYG
jgi:hypothetical protein